MKFRAALALLLSCAVPATALAQPHVIAQLGTAPLIGRVSSTAQLQDDVRRRQRLFESAGTKLGLTPDEYAQFAMRIRSKQLAYVTLPRRLDAMSWSSGGHVYVLHDVVIPANTKGWEIDLREGSQIVALFVPARCGNLSIVRRALPAVAEAPAPALPQPAVTSTPAPEPTSEPAAAPVVVVVPSAPAATPAPYQSVAASTGPAHHMRWWPLLLLPVAALLLHSRGGSTPIAGPVIAGRPVTAPTPAPVAGCTPPPQ